MKVQRFVISAPGQRDLKILRPVPTPSSPWGALESLRLTPWGTLIPVVDGEAFSHALHGYFPPLLRVLGRPPAASALKVPEPYRVCAQHSRRCPLAGPDCQPGAKLPDCYDPPGLDSEEAKLAAAVVALAWAEGRYVVVVEGDEFSL
ncbi:MAG: hypothetical protein A2Y38_17515 [Spirochaetes bacterium GWB1_59_5]|nr:MAG: hypothetical protein A2Y38_17515 [Spirochaetes bacterium GWB1_59_5]